MKISYKLLVNRMLLNGKKKNVRARKTCNHVGEKKKKKADIWLELATADLVNEKAAVAESSMHSDWKTSDHVSEKKKKAGSEPDTTDLVNEQEPAVVESSMRVSKTSEHVSQENKTTTESGFEPDTTDLVNKEPAVDEVSDKEHAVTESRSETRLGMDTDFLDKVSEEESAAGDSRKNKPPNTVSQSPTVSTDDESCSSDSDEELTDDEDCNSDYEKVLFSTLDKLELKIMEAYGQGQDDDMDETVVLTEEEAILKQRNRKCKLREVFDSLEDWGPEQEEEARLAATDDGLWEGCD